MSADVDGGCNGALAFGLVVFLTTADDEDAPRLGDGCRLGEGDNWPEPLSSSTETFLDLPMTALFAAKQVSVQSSR